MHLPEVKNIPLVMECIASYLPVEEAERLLELVECAVESALRKVRRTCLTRTLHMKPARRRAEAPDFCPFNEPDYVWYEWRIGLPVYDIVRIVGPWIDGSGMVVAHYIDYESADGHFNWRWKEDREWAVGCMEGVWQNV
jgi:hypothetical protein